jgi:hypothetical protein
MDCFGVQSVDTISRCTSSYLLAGPACLWCLVLFGRLAISQTMVLHAVLLASLRKLSMSRGALTWFDLRLFESAVWKMSTSIELFFEWKLNKIKTEYYIGIWGCSWKSFWWVKFNRVYFTIFRAKVWKIFLVNFVTKNSNKLQKLGLEEKITWVPDVLTLGPTAQARLFLIKVMFI